MNRNAQTKLREQERETTREYFDRESHYAWGKRYLLKIAESKATPKVELQHNRMLLQVRPGSDRDEKQSIVVEWYREQIKTAAKPLLAKWEPVVGVAVEKTFVRRMKTKWGSCNTHAKNIRLNSELAKKPPECLEYILVHELVHLLEPTHNQQFTALMDRFMPNWQFHREELNRLPVRHESWEY